MHAQRKYTTIEKELLSIVMVLKEFRSMLFGCRELQVYTDHCNLTYSNLKTERVLRWRLYLEEYNPVFHYVKGPDNKVADALSRLPYREEQSANNALEHRSPLYDPYDDEAAYAFTTQVDDDELLECFLNFPVLELDKPFPLDYNHFAAAQAADNDLQQLLFQQPNRYFPPQLAPEMSLVVYPSKPNDPWKICLPTAMLQDVIKLYHLSLNHVGMTRLHDSMALYFYHPRLRSSVEAFVCTCDACQRDNITTHQYKELPP
jgi:RNase H-like domain found in reverse transcriptase/Integrase zinc binding domain